MNKRTILFIHQGFPGQFGSLAASLAAEGHRVLSLAMNPNANVKGVTLIRHVPDRTKSAEELPLTLAEIDAKLIRAESAFKVMKAIRKQGINPDVIYAHPGWGEAIYVKDIWPNARYVAYGEWFYNLHGQEVNFDPAMPVLTDEQEMKLTVKNIPFLIAVSEADAVISPTQWQKSRFPAWAQEKIHVVHDGINLQELAQVKPRSLGMPARNLKLRKGMPIVTFSARHLEPVRGFHYFMRSLPFILNANPQAHVIVMGKDAGVKNAGYGGPNPQGMTWRQSMEKELGDKVDWSRVHFLGELDRKLYLAIMKLSACHVYLTVPFILSWSFLEAAGLGIPIVASNTQPLQEVKDLSGLRFVNFDDPQGIGQKVTETLAAGPADYSRENLEKLRDFDHCVALPKTRNILLESSDAIDMGGQLEKIVWLDD